jgi:hypothetical protein
MRGELEKIEKTKNMQEERAWRASWNKQKEEERNRK